jgi:hypothetical protein
MAILVGKGKGGGGRRRSWRPHEDKPACALKKRRSAAGEGARRRPSTTDPASFGRHDRKKWGNPNYTALNVLLDDGSRQLFWHHELEEVAPSDARGT